MDDVAAVAVDQRRPSDAFRRPDGDLAVRDAQHGAGDGCAMYRIAVTEQDGIVLTQLRRIHTAEDIVPLTPLGGLWLAHRPDSGNRDARRAALFWRELPDHTALLLACLAFQAE